MSFLTKLFGRKTDDSAITSDEALHLSDQAIQLARQGQITPREMLDRLAMASLFIPLAEPPVLDGQKVKSWKPATISKADGSQWVVAFSSTALASAFSGHNPAYAHGLGIGTTWVIQSIPEAHGLVVNIGSPNTFEWSAEGIHRYKADVLVKSEF